MPLLRQKGARLHRLEQDRVINRREIDPLRFIYAPSYVIIVFIQPGVIDDAERKLLNHSLGCSSIDAVDTEDFSLSICFDLCVEIILNGEKL